MLILALVLTVRVLGPVELYHDGQPVDLGGPQQRAVLAHLALDAGRVLSVERLVDRLWGDDPPRTTLGTLQSYVSRLRRAIEPARSAGTAPRVLVSEAPGYVLQVPPEQVDVHRFRSLAAEARAAAAAGDHRSAVQHFDAALELWRGPALAGVGPDEQVRAIVVRLDEEREAVIEDRFAALLALGRHAEAIPRLQAAVDEQPMREGLWALLALALYRSSRQADALRVMSSARTMLRDELGLEPGFELRDLERRILDQDPTLILAVQPAPVPVPVPQHVAATPTAELVGRIDEWRSLANALAAGGRGQSQLVLIDGEPGIGKSTLSDAFLAHATAAGWSVAVGRCVEPGLAPSLWPCLEIVRAMFAGTAPSGAPVPGTSTPGPSTPGSSTDRTPGTSAPGSSRPGTTTSADAPTGTTNDGATTSGTTTPGTGASDAAGGVAGPAANVWRRLIDGVGGSGVSLAPVEMADQFVALVDELGRPGWVILLDDLHWADQPTLDVVRLTLERLGARPVVVVGALRPPEITPGSLLGQALGGLRHAAAAATRVHMSPLDATGVARLMEITAGVAPSGDLAQRVQARAGGNPLFVTELARLAGERGLDDDSVVPDAIRDVVRGRLAGLPERATAELEIAAVLGERFDLRTVMAASERDPDSCLDALDAAIVTRILVPEAGGFRFAHALVRDAVLAEASSLRLARLHHRAAEAIIAVRGDGPDEAEPIAHHRLASTSFADPVVVAKALVRASDIARWRGAHDAGGDMADRALDLLADAPRTAASRAVEADALEAIVSAAWRRGDADLAAAAVVRVHEFADRTGSDFAIALSLFLAWGKIDDVEHLDEVLEPVGRARELLARTTDPYTIVVARYMVCSYAMLVGDIAEAAEHAALAVAASGTTRADEVPEHVPLVLLPLMAAMVAAMQGNVALAREHTHLRAPAWLTQRSEVDPATVPALAFGRALVEAVLGNSQNVLDELRGLPSIQTGGFVLEQGAMCDLLVGCARARSGEPDGIDDALAGLARIETSGELILRGCLLSFIAEACLDLDDRRAVALLDRAHAAATSRGEMWWMTETLRLQAECDLRFGDGTSAARLLDQAQALAVRQGAALVCDRIAQTRAKLSAAVPG